LILAFQFNNIAQLKLLLLMKKSQNFLFIFLTILFLFSCTEKKDNQLSKNDGPIILQSEKSDNELNISYQVPSGLEEMPASLSEKMVGRVAKRGEDEVIIYTPKSVYFNSKTNSLLRIGKIHFKNVSSTESLTTSQYSELFRKYNNEMEIIENKLTDTQLNILQMQVSKNNLMTLKFLFLNKSNSLIEFDFSFKSENYNQLYPSILSSIKSIKLL
jgi:acyl-coenzyme A synthetase/AMP-(fatty) acid ligase